MRKRGNIKAVYHGYMWNTLLKAESDAYTLKMLELDSIGLVSSSVLATAFYNVEIEELW